MSPLVGLINYNILILPFPGAFEGLSLEAVFFGEVAGEGGRIAVGDGDGMCTGGEAGGFVLVEVGMVAQYEASVVVAPSAGTVSSPV